MTNIIVLIGKTASGKMRLAYELLKQAEKTKQKIRIAKIYKKSSSNEFFLLYDPITCDDTESVKFTEITHSEDPRYFSQLLVTDICIADSLDCAKQMMDCMYDTNFTVAYIQALNEKDRLNRLVSEYADRRTDEKVLKETSEVEDKDFAILKTDPFELIFKNCRYVSLLFNDYTPESMTNHALSILDDIRKRGD